MTGKYHVNNDGRVMPCNAQSGNCPFGGDDQHFDSFEEAQLAADKKNEVDDEKKEKKKMRTFHYGNFINIEIGQEVTVARCGSGHTVFGEPASLERTTKQHLVFKTESGQTVKCPIDNMSHTVGKADQAGYFIIVRKFEDVKNIIRHPVMF